MAKDPYTVLGVPRTADEETIRGAYRRLAKQYHPDLHPNDPSAAQKMNELNEAYDAIRNPRQSAQPERGAAYAHADAGYADSRGYGGYRGAYAEDQADPWEEIFREAERQRRSAPKRTRFRIGRLIWIVVLGYLFFSFFTGGFWRLMSDTQDSGGRYYAFPFEEYETAPFTGGTQED